ncbi:deleted in malignant brain tumors 1 protein-like [Carcharodon carcharias]|uniref:deleted in malignant brain tumors 1 protein-like n=1 Tax=Carcharodon carcharias TaxID=13397 RepID=UPI001B7EF701|nr:deleted in malignant brain tumors 1 protein-like [Carcharodon carcharias]XP_041038153.1 deleted in malignant brain tumors 1 protein-like [Carcharodon carcharias]XP_041038154.1 deleted in malignant brain tumors 1 protein-like [Carcharodon carcharias]
MKLDAETERDSEEIFYLWHRRATMNSILLLAVRLVILCNLVSADSTQVRLVAGNDSCSGRVEVYHNNAWGAVCDNHWDMLDASVVCRQVDCGPAKSAPGSAHFGAANGSFWLDDVECKGTEINLFLCRAKSLGEHNCRSSEAASVICSDSIQVRLIAGSDSCSGRVEVYYNNIWGAVCDDNWDMLDANVVCRQVGCGPAKSAPGSAHFGAATGSFWLDDVECKGTESNLFPCRANSLGKHNCGSSEAASVICSDSIGMQLVSGNDSCSGRVEVYYNNAWGAVCDHNWDMLDASVVCRQMDCGPAKSAPGSAHFGAATGSFWLDDVECKGTESNLFPCRAKSLGEHNCSSGEAASVICLDSIQVRLVAGNDSCSGRVEVYHNNAWGAVCDHNWDMLDASVVCRQVGCGPAKSAPGSAHFGAANGSFWLDDVECKGTESNLFPCRANSLGEHNCSSGEAASVICAEPIPLRLMDGVGACSGRLELYYNHTWGSVCDDYWDLLDANVACRQMGCGSAKSAPQSAHFGPATSPFWLDDVKCKGRERNLFQCQANSLGEHNCGAGEAASVICSGPIKMRLIDGMGPCSGRVEVYYNNTWGAVCADHWDMLDAQVACRQMDCGSAKSATRVAHSGAGSGPLWLGDVECTGTELNIVECQMNQWGEHNCDTGEAATIVCTGHHLVEGPIRLCLSVVLLVLIVILLITQLNTNHRSKRSTLEKSHPRFVEDSGVSSSTADNLYEEISL